MLGLDRMKSMMAADAEYLMVVYDVHTEILAEGIAGKVIRARR